MTNTERFFQVCAGATFAFWPPVFADLRLEEEKVERRLLPSDLFLTNVLHQREDRKLLHLFFCSL